VCSSLKKLDSMDNCAAELTRGIRSGAFLIEGLDKDRINKEVLEMAKGLFCSVIKDRSGYCQSCSDCQMLAKGSHPDLYWIRAEAGSAVIKIEDIRLLKERLSVKPFQAQNKICIIEDAQRLNVAAANALLKTLEEPPAGVVLILITASASQLLETVVSRCARIRFSQDASGNDVDSDEKDDMITGFFKKDDRQVQEKLYDDLGSIERKQAVDLLSELVGVFRDMLMIGLGVENVNLMSSKSVQILREFAQNFSLSDIETLIDEILHTKQNINGNANMKLSMDLLIKTINKRSSKVQLF